ncbi:HEAT repeat domain-containing protein [Crocosphaera watsonii]|nr:HEAT repeat domain-containing protein [Crocosphaera watsonii]
MGSENAIFYLVQAVNDSDDNVRLNAIESIGKIGSRSPLIQDVKY